MLQGNTNVRIMCLLPSTKMHNYTVMSDLITELTILLGTKVCFFQSQGF